MRRFPTAAAALLVGALAGRTVAQAPYAKEPAARDAAARGAAENGAAQHGAPAFVLRDDSGLDFVHHRFPTPDKKYLPETVGSGIALLDYDGDGRLDVFCVQCCPLPGNPQGFPPQHDALYRNVGVVDGRLRFRRVPEVVTVKTADGKTHDAPLGLRDAGYGMGVTCPDVDNDGDPDLYVTRVGPDVLYRNDGDGTFTDVTAEAGVADDLWSAAAAWADFDRDGDLDLYLGNYALIDYAHYKICHLHERLIYCHPDSLPSAPDRLFRNDGGFRFTEVTKEAGIVEPDQGGKALAAIPWDWDEDGRLDLYVANDADPNFLWHNVTGPDGKMKFEEVGAGAGVAVDGKGRSQSCMGSDIADVNGDLRLDVVSANLGKEGTVLYVQGEEHLFDDRSWPSGLGGPSYLFTGFGLRFFDYDFDADPDLIVVNGHILNNAHDIDPNQTFEQVPHFFENRGDGTFLQVGPRLSPFFERPDLGRGLAVGDLDGDGDEDVVVLEADHQVALLENVVATQNHRVTFRLIGTKSPRDPVGARVTLVCGDKTQLQELHPTASYLSWQDLRMTFGVGARTAKASARIVWPSGRVQELKDLDLDVCHRIVEPE